MGTLHESKIINITKNCEAALRQLRHSHEKRTIWIDSICIDQSSVQERNHQVGMMDKIYQYASTVKICIADSDHDHGKAMRLIAATEMVLWDLDRQSKKPFNLEAYLGELSYVKHKIRRLSGDYAETVLTSFYFYHLAALFNRRYFTRVWVIQEALLARTANLHVNGDIAPFSGRIFDFLQFLHYGLHNSPEHRSLSLWTTACKGNNSIVSRLDMSIDLCSSDPRDKVFAVTSLLQPHTRDLISINYTADLDSVFADAVTACIAECGDLDIVCYASLSEDADTMTGSSFSMIQFKDFLNHRERDGYQHGSLVSYLTSAWNRNTVLNSNGKDYVPRFDHRTAIFNRWKNTCSQIANIPPATVRRCAGVIPKTQIMPRLKVSAHMIDICTTITQYTLDHFMSEGADGTWCGTLEMLSVFDLSEVLKEPHSTLPSHALDRTNQVNLKLDLRRLQSYTPSSKTQHFFRTHYSFGFSSAHGLPGDHIFAIDGAQHPFLLREVGPDEYRIVGKCYVWAAMELDYWNPGTHKGIWTHRPFDLGSQQTRQIEIY